MRGRLSVLTCSGSMCCKNWLVMKSVISLNLILKRVRVSVLFSEAGQTFWILKYGIIQRRAIQTHENLMSRRRKKERKKALKLQMCSSLAGITSDCAEPYKRRQSWGNNLDVLPADRSYWALRKPWRHLIRHLSSSLQTISWARLESILGLSLPTQSGRRTLKYDGWRKRKHKPLLTERDSIYTYDISSERRLLGGAETEHFYEQMQTDVGHWRHHFNSCSGTGISKLLFEWARRFKEAVLLQYT